MHTPPAIDLSLIAHEHRPLSKVLMHRPGPELERLTEASLPYFNFASVPDADRFREEHEALVSAIREMGSEPVFVEDVLAHDAEALAYMGRRANMVFTRDLAVTFPSGMMLAGMAIDGRKGDPDIVGRACELLGVPVVGRLEPDGMLEGGGATFFGGDTAIVGECKRTNPAGLAQFEAIARASGLRRLVTIACPPWDFHIDGFLVFIDRDLAIVDRRGLTIAPSRVKDLVTGETREVMMDVFLRDEGVEMIEVSPEDGWAAVNFVMTAPRQIVGYDWADRVMNEVVKRGGRAIGVRGEELRKGNGGPHCMTCPLERR